MPLQLISTYPRVSDLLDKHLGNSAARTPAVSFAIGRHLAWMLRADEAWILPRIPMVLPSAPGEQDNWTGAWIGFLQTQPDMVALRHLEPHYRSAAKLLWEEPTVNEDDGHPNALFMRHLLAFYVHGHIGIEEDGVLDRFFAAASARRRSKAMRHLGRLLEKLGAEHPEIASRVAVLVDARLTAIQCHELDGDEFCESGRLFASGPFNAKWVIDRLSRVLALCPRIEPARSVVETLRFHASTDSAQALSGLRRLLSGIEDEWRMRIITEESVAVIRALIANGPKPVAEGASELANELIAKGHTRFMGALQ